MRIGPMRTTAPGCTDLQSTRGNTTFKMIPKASRLQVPSSSCACRLQSGETPSAVDVAPVADGDDEHHEHPVSHFVDGSIVT